jgi:hypothetical protein
LAQKKKGGVLQCSSLSLFVPVNAFSPSSRPRIAPALASRVMFREQCLQTRNPKLFVAECNASQPRGYA